MRLGLRARPLLLLLAILTVVACSDEGAPADELDTLLRDVAAAEDDHFAREHTYTAVLEDLRGIDAGDARTFNIVITVNPDVGYCIEGGDEQETWHILQASDAVVEGDCP